jgi:hypothetical protein
MADADHKMTKTRNDQLTAIGQPTSPPHPDVYYSPAHLPPLPPQNVNSPYETLPPGWSVVTSSSDGRIYYWEKGTGRTSWTHPLAADMPPSAARTLGQLSPPPPPEPTRTHYPRQQQRSGGWSPWGFGNNDMTRSEWHDTPLNATRRPENHQCYAICSLFLFFPLGLCACMHSFQVDRSWQQGRFGDAVNHSRQATNYACFGTFVGICIWIYLLVLRERRFEWPDWNFD